MYITDHYYRYASSMLFIAIIVCVASMLALVVPLKDPIVAEVFYWLGIGFSGITATLFLTLIGRSMLRRIYQGVASKDSVENRTRPQPATSVSAAEMFAASPSRSAHFSYAIERLPNCVAEINAHACAHWAEMGSRTDIRALAVDWDAYLVADRAGRITLGTARRDGKLIGYLCMMHRSDLHSKGTVTADSAFYYVEERPMRGLVERNLIRFVLKHLAETGFSYVRFRNKISHSNAPILKSLGFVPDEISYVLQK